MSNKLDEKKKILQIKKLEIQLLEKEIAKLSVSENSPIDNRFPLHSTVILVGKSEKHRLLQKKATIIGHTTCFVKLRRREEEFLRAPENLRFDEHAESKKESRGGKRTG